MLDKIIYGWIGHLSFDLTVWYCQYQQTHSDTENYRSVWRHMMFDTDKCNNISFEGRNIYYH